MNTRSARIIVSSFLFAFGLTALSGTSTDPDYRKLDPLLRKSGVAVLRHAQKNALGAELDSAPLVPVILRTATDDPSLERKIRILGGTARRVSGRITTARIPVNSLRYISNWASLSYIESARRVRPMLDLSGPVVSADAVHAGTGLPSGTGFTGRGVLTGIVDTGLNATHPDFNAGVPPVSRVARSFSFSSGVSALVDTDGHGSHVAGIAAGNGIASNGTYTGMAPEAGIMVGRAGISSFLVTDIINAVSDLFGYAETVAGKPAAVNLSLGSTSGPHDGTGSFESAIDALAGTGGRRLVTVAAGNEKDLKEHFRATAFAFGSVNATLTLKQDSQSGTAVVDIWAEGGDRYTVTAARGSESATAADGSFVSNESETIAIANRTDTPPNLATHIQVFFSRPPASNLSASIRLDRVRNGGKGKIDAYIDFLDGNFTGSGVDPSVSIIEPANGHNVLSVGSFQTKTASGAPGSQGISSFSSRGPTRDGRRKPDLTAPGEVIYSVRSSQAQFPPSAIVPGNDNYAILAGTSMSAPHVAGIAALVWESNPGLTGAQMRERLRRTANLVGTAPDDTWGHGKIDALRAVRESVASITAPSIGVPFVPVSLSSENSSPAFTGNSLVYTWTLDTKPPGSVATLFSFSPVASFTPDLPGDYTVRLSVSQVSPPGTPPGVATASVHVNHIPSASFTVPASVPAGQPATFHGTASDEDNQALALHWIMVSRPPRSTATIAAASEDNAVFLPDQPGTYEIGLYADDGLDNSALFVRSYTTLGLPGGQTSSGGGGGCLTVSGSQGEPAGVDALFSFGVLLLPCGAIAVRRFLRRKTHPLPFRHPVC
jgi:subtilisin family serine protease